MKRYGRGSGPTKVTVTYTFHEVGRTEDKSLTVEVDADIWPGSPATRWEPEQGPETDIREIRFVEFCDGNGDAVEVGDWAPTFEAIAYRLSGKYQYDYELKEEIGRAATEKEEWERDEYYDRRRNELRGC